MGAGDGERGRPLDNLERLAPTGTQNRAASNEEKPARRGIPPGLGDT
jgi:hypothetical protein